MSTQATARILEAHANVKDLSLMESKMKFIQAWQSLPEYGVTLFVIKFDGHKKEELLGVAHNRIMRMDINNGDHLKIWRYNTMKVSPINIHSGFSDVKGYSLFSLFRFVSGLECELGNQMHDDSIPRCKCCFLMFIIRL